MTAKLFMKALVALGLLAAAGCPMTPVADAGSSADGGFGLPSADAGVQQAEGGLGQPCFANQTCSTPLVCEEGVCIDDTIPEGAEGGFCYPNGTCNAGLFCASTGYCIAESAPDTGAFGGPCYPNGTCNEPYVCRTDETCGFEEGGNGPAIINLVVSPNFVAPGESSTVTWSTAEADTCTLNGQDVEVVGSQEVTPTQTTDYVLYCTNAFGEVQRTITLQVLAPVAILSFSTTTNAIDEGLAVELSWQTANAVSCELQPGIGAVPTTAMAYSYVPPSSQELTLSCKGIEGPAVRTLSLVVNPAVQLVEFSVDGAVDSVDVTSLEPVVVEWHAVNTSGCLLEHDGDPSTDLVPVAAQSAVAAGPFEDSVTLSITCEGVAGPAFAAVDVNVELPPSIELLELAPSTIDEGGTTLVLWSASSAEYCELADDDGLLEVLGPTGELSVSAVASTTFTLTCFGLFGLEAAESIDLLVLPAITGVTLSGVQAQAVFGEDYDLAWDAPNADECELILPDGSTLPGLAASGQTSGIVVTTAPNDLANYTIHCIGPGAPVLANHQVTVDEIVHTGNLVLDGSDPNFSSSYILTINRITGDLEVRNWTFVFDLSRLFAVEGDVTFSSNDGLISVSLPHLRSAQSVNFISDSFGFELGNPDLGSLTLPELETVGDFAIAAQETLGNVAAPALTGVSGDFLFFGKPTCGSLDFGSLVSIGGTMDLRGFGASTSPVESFPALTSVGGASVLDQHPWGPGEVSALQSQVTFTSGLSVGAETISCP